MRKGKPCGDTKNVVAELSPTSKRKVGKVVVLMTKVFNVEIIEAACVKEFGIPENEVGLVITAARAELIKATDYHVKEEYGRMLMALRELFTSSVKIKDNKTALAILKEIIRLQGLQDKEQQTAESPESAELLHINEQIKPFLENVEEGVPVLEKLRLLLIDYMRLRNESSATRPAPGGHGGAKLQGVARKTRHLPASANKRPGKKK